MDQIINFFTHSAFGVVTLIGVILALAFSVFTWTRFKFWAMDIAYTIPFFGRISRMAKNPTTSPKSGWTSEEQTLCGDYSQFAKIISEPDFKDTLEYLRLSGDLGREPMPAWAWFFIALLVLAEGYGFSYLLSTWIARDGDANLYRVMAAFISIVICGIMLWLTHNSGREIHRTGLLRSCRMKFNSGARAQTGTHEYYTEPMGIGVHADRALPMHVQTANRVANHGNDEGLYAWTISAIIAIIFIAVLSYWMRHENLRRDIIKQEHTLQQTQTGNPFAADALPANSGVTTLSDADKKAREDGFEAEKSEGSAAFLMLAVIFIFTQIVSIGLGFRYGFAGLQGRRAYENTNGYVTYSSYYNSPIFRLAQARLQTLQQKIEQNSHNRQGVCKTYSDYCAEEAQHETAIRATTSSGQYATPPSADELAAKINALQSREEKLALLATINDEPLRARVHAILARWKSAPPALAATRAREEAEFGDVL
jgi:hypothetical protein